MVQYGKLEPSLNFTIQGVNSNVDFANAHQSDCDVMAGSTDKPSGNGIAANPDEEDTYCAVFSDPSECEQQRVRGVMKYWTNMEVRTGLLGMHCNRRTYLAAAPIVAHKDSTHGTSDTCLELLTQVRHELWKTMSALAELELRENAQHKAAKARAIEEATLFK